MFSPKWKKEAKHLVKAALKFLHYKRDLLEEWLLDERALLAADDDGMEGDSPSRFSDVLDALDEVRSETRPEGARYSLLCNWPLER